MVQRPSALRRGIQGLTAWWTGRATAARRFRPGVDVLEDRCLLTTAWTPWSGLGGRLKDAVALNTGDGGQQVFAIAADDTIWTRSQNAVSGTVGEWTSLGGYGIKDLDVVTTGDGRRQLFAIAADDAVWRRSQAPATGAWGGWSPVSARGVKQVDAVAGGNGRPQVFLIGADNSVWTRGQDANGTWG